MSTAAVFSEWSKYAARILDGTKRYEYRRRPAARRLDVIYVYEVAPVSAVVGMVEVSDQGIRETEALWADTWRDSGMDRGEFDDYVAGREQIAYYHLERPHRFPEPIPLSYFGLDVAPQSFAYVPAELIMGQLSLDGLVVA